MARRLVSQEEPVPAALPAHLSWKQEPRLERRAHAQTVPVAVATAWLACAWSSAAFPAGRRPARRQCRRHGGFAPALTIYSDTPLTNSVPRFLRRVHAGKNNQRPAQT